MRSEMSSYTFPSLAFIPFLSSLWGVVKPLIRGAFLLGLVLAGLGASCAPVHSPSDEHPEERPLLLLYFSTAAKRPSPLPASRPLGQAPSLEEALGALLGEEAPSYGIVVQPLPQGPRTALNPDTPFHAASLYKLAVLYEVFRQERQGQLRLDDSLLITPAYAAYDLGTLAPELIGREVTIAAALEAMITTSDNTTAMLLLDRVGARSINQSMAELGLHQTRLGAPALSTSAGDMAALLAAIAMGVAVDEEASQQMLDLLARQQINDRIPALLPPEICVAHKTANWADATHDAGIVYTPQGAYLVVLLSKKEDDASTLRLLSRFIYDHLVGHEGALREASMLRPQTCLAETKAEGEGA